MPANNFTSDILKIKDLILANVIAYIIIFRTIKMFPHELDFSTI